eukprot:4060305-Heterocapsa_arctica.AAC.1
MPIPIPVPIPMPIRMFSCDPASGGRASGSQPGRLVGRPRLAGNARRPFNCSEGRNPESRHSSCT